MITENDELSERLDQAALLWPECKSRTELLRRILDEGSKAIELKATQISTERVDALNRLISAGTGMWPADFDEQRKAEWPD
jgi:hypothetical protein